MSTNGWPMTPLVEIVDPVQRRVEVLPGQSYRTLGVKWWGEGAYERKTIDGSETAVKTLNEVCEDDLIINKIWVRNGSVAVVTGDVAGCVGSNEFPTFECRRHRVLPRWLHWYSKTRELWQKCDALSQGSSGKNRIRPERFLTIDVPLPPLEEQQRIVARIDYLAERIEEVRDTRQLADDETQALLRSRFSQLVESAPRQRMDDVAPLTRRKAEIREGETYAELGIRCFGNGTFHKPALDFLSVGTKKLYSIEPGDLVFSNVFAWEGAIAVAQPEDGGRYGSHRFITCVPEPGVAIADFLCFYFLTPEGMEQIGEASPGGAGRNRTLGLKKLAEMEVPVPDFEQQQEFADLLRKVRQMQREKDATAAELDAFLPSILDRAFRGEL
ncbi:MAG: restriction endonuclease subunit S [Pirellulaceae bacterium]